jgi:hypothetical protein
VQERFLWHFPYLGRVQGVLDGVPRGPVDPLGPLEKQPGPPQALRGEALAPHARLGFGRIVVSEAEVPNILVTLV